MSSAIYNIEIEEGVKVAMLFTPRLYLYKGREGVTFEYEKGNDLSLHSFYADLMFAAALNHWELTHSAEIEFPYSRVDFHAYAAAQPKSFGKAVLFAVQTISGKTLKEIASETNEAQELEQGSGDIKKKSLRGWITRLLRRS